MQETHKIEWSKYNRLDINVAQQLMLQIKNQYIQCMNKILISLLDQIASNYKENAFKI